MRYLTALLVIMMATASFSVMAHSGRTDKNGCHVEKKTGIRHCH